MPLDWSEVQRRYGAGAKIPTVADPGGLFVGILARPAWRTRFRSCVPHDHPAARFLLVAFPSCGRRLEW